MSVKYEVTVTAIGKLARKFLESNNSVILLDEGAHPNLAEMVIEHTPSELTGDLVAGDTLTIGKQKYKIVRVGENGEHGAEYQQEFFHESTSFVSRHYI